MLVEPVPKSEVSEVRWEMIYCLIKFRIKAKFKMKECKWQKVNLFIKEFPKTEMCQGRREVVHWLIKKHSYREMREKWGKVIYWDVDSGAKM